MERAEGSLQYLRAGKRSILESAKAGRDIAKALADLHQQRIVHRDVKPSNVLQLRSGKYVLADYGIAKLLTVSAGTGGTGAAGPGPLTEGGQGSSGFIPPEGLTSPYTPAPSFDVFSLGMLLYVLATGRMPFPGRSGYEADKAIDHGERPNLASVQHAGLEDLIQRMWAQDPLARPSISTVQEELEAIAQAAAAVDQKLISVDVAAPGEPPRASPQPITSPAESPPRLNPQLEQHLSRLPPEASATARRGAWWLLRAKRRARQLLMYCAPSRRVAQPAAMAM